MSLISVNIKCRYHIRVTIIMYFIIHQALIVISAWYINKRDDNSHTDMVVSSRTLPECIVS
jgi:hypothetical protein